jgi:DNA polymerase
MATKNPEIAEVVADVRERLVYLRELGVTSINVKLPERTENTELRSESRATTSVAGKPPELKTEVTKTSDARPAGSRLALLPSLQNRKSPPFFDKHNPPETSDKQIASAAIETDKSVLFQISPTLPEPTETVELIRAEIGKDCTRCKLSTLGRSQVVNSVGNFAADLMFVGEAPGADEDRLGEPFVGRAGQLLTDIIKAIGMTREQVFIGNINRCRPPGNRAPEPDESVVCKPFLLREIAVVRPKVIVVLGATAAQNLLETKVPIGKLRGHFHDYLGVKVMPTFHPAYLLRDPHKKREVWEDMKIVRDYLLKLKNER